MSILVGDIGGTSSRFAFARDRMDPGALSDIEVMRNAEHTGLGETIESYLQKVGDRPTFAVIAIAGPVGKGDVRLTNLNWHFSAAGLSAQIGCETLLINDWQALACALPYIPAADLRQIGPAEPLADASKAALGPGTGLGVAGLARWHGRWIPLPSEGGHIELAATTPEEFELFALIRKEHGRVSGETVISGPGLARLHAARAALHGFGVPPGGLAAAEITAHALDGSDPDCVASAKLLLQLLARFAGDVALMFGAIGGVYLHGGVTQKLSPLIDPASFRAEFEAKAPHERWLGNIATMYIADPTPALLGCAAMALDRFR